MYLIEDNWAGAIWLAYNQRIILSLLWVRATENKIKEVILNLFFHPNNLSTSQLQHPVYIYNTGCIFYSVFMDCMFCGMIFISSRFDAAYSNCEDLMFARTVHDCIAVLRNKFLITWGSWGVWTGFKLWTGLKISLLSFQRWIVASAGLIKHHLVIISINSLLVV